MIRVIQRRLIIPRGDTGTFTVPALSPGQAGSVGVFTIFDPITKTRIFQKQVELEGNVFNIEFGHGDTVNLQAGDYLWDIKFYKNPIFADNKVIDGEEIDSYYAAFQTPKCEIRETGDAFMSIEGAHADIEDINLILAATQAANAAKDAATEQAGIAADKAEQAATRLAEMIAAIPTKVSELENDSGYLSEETDPTVPAWAKAQTKPSYTPQEVGALPDNTFIPSRISDLVDDSGHYTKPVNGIPASDLEETYVKFDDYATHDGTKVGVIGVLPNGGGGLGISPVGGRIHVIAASETATKGGTEQYHPIVSNIQHASTFYGLAKAAGSDEKNSTLPVGQYTNAAKAAIQQMLGVPSTADIPTNVSELTNDAGYLTQHQDISGKANSADLAAVATSGSYEDLSNKPTIPDIQIAGNSIVENGVASIPVANGNLFGLVKIDSSSGIAISSSGYLQTAAPSTSQIKSANKVAGTYRPIVPSVQHISTFYGLAKAAGDTTQSESDNAVGTYTDSAKTAIQTMLDVPSNAAMTTAIGNAIGNINSFDMAVVQALPTEDISTHTIYLVPKTGETNDVYDEYVYINNAWEMVGNTQVDLSNYVQKTDYATTDAGGIIKVANSSASQAAENGGSVLINDTLYIVGANTERIKNGSDLVALISAARQNYATFYGLAKAAGADMKDIANTTIGIYPDAQKAAIQSMLGISQILAPVESDGQADRLYAIGDVFTYNGKLYKATATIAESAAFAVGTNCEEISIGEDFVKRTDYANANTAGVIKASSNVTGIGINNEGFLYISPPTKAEIKTGTDTQHPVTSSKIKEATFYGLAKAAGDTTQSQSNNAVGTYTTEAKAAIQTMLNVPSNADLTLKADKTDTVLETTLSRGRKDNTTVGTASIAFGVDTEASGYYSVALGLNTTASSQGAFAEGKNTVARYIAHAEGEDTQALGQWAHSQGVGTIANGAASFAGGDNTIANGHASFVTGRYNAADSYDNWPTWAANTSYEVGDRVKRNLMVQNEPTDVGYHCTVANNDATFDNAHWELDGYHMNYVEIVGNGKEYEDPETHQTVRAGSNAYALEWNGTAHYAGDVYVNANADSTGGSKVLVANDVPVESGTDVGSVKTKDVEYNNITYSNIASGIGSFAAGLNTIASGYCSRAEGYNTTASGHNSFASGIQTIASGSTSIAEGEQTIASGFSSHAEGFLTKAIGNYTHAEGQASMAYGTRSLACGRNTKAIGENSYTAGNTTIANGGYSYVIGQYNIGDAYDSSYLEWTANTAYKVGDKVKITTVDSENSITSVRGYKCKTANSDAEFTSSNWTPITIMNYVNIVGNGTKSNARSNAYALGWDGTGHYMGDVYVGANADSTGGIKVATVAELATKLDAAEAGLKVVRLI